MDVTRITEQLLFTTVRIEGLATTGAASTGTGFIFDYEEAGHHVLFLVTNKHVIDPADFGALTFTQGEDATNAKPKLGVGYRLQISDFKQLWVGHPDTGVDISVTAFVPLAEHVKSQGTDIFFRSVNRGLIPTSDQEAELGVLEQIVFIGYPNGLWDAKHFLPIVRSGITATPPSVDFQGEKQFLVDASVFPGSSGSPVFLYNPGMYTNAQGGVVLGSRFMFLGVIASVFIRQDVNQVQLVSSPPAGVPATVSTQMLDLGVVFKARTVEEACANWLRVRGITLPAA